MRMVHRVCRLFINAGSLTLLEPLGPSPFTFLICNAMFLLSFNEARIWQTLTPSVICGL